MTAALPACRLPPPPPTFGVAFDSTRCRWAMAAILPPPAAAYIHCYQECVACGPHYRLTSDTRFYRSPPRICLPNMPLRAALPRSPAARLRRHLFFSPLDMTTKNSCSVNTACHHTTIRSILATMTTANGLDAGRHGRIRIQKRFFQHITHTLLAALYHVAPVRHLAFRLITAYNLLLSGWTCYAALLFAI